MGLVQRFRTELNYIKDKKELVETLKELDKYMDGEVETDKEFKKLSKRAGFLMHEVDNIEKKTGRSK